MLFTDTQMFAFCAFLFFFPASPSLGDEAQTSISLLQAMQSISKQHDRADRGAVAPWSLMVVEWQPPQKTYPIWEFLVIQWDKAILTVELTLQLLCFHINGGMPCSTARPGFDPWIWGTDPDHEVKKKKDKENLLIKEISIRNL